MNLFHLTRSFTGVKRKPCSSPNTSGCFSRLNAANEVKIAWRAGAKRRANRPAARDVSAGVTHKLRPSLVRKRLFLRSLYFYLFSRGSVLQESPPLPYFHPIRLRIIRPVGGREAGTVEKRDKERAGKHTHTHTRWFSCHRGFIPYRCNGVSTVQTVFSVPFTRTLRQTHSSHKTTAIFSFSKHFILNDL